MELGGRQRRPDRRGIVDARRDGFVRQARVMVRQHPAAKLDVGVAQQAFEQCARDHGAQVLALRHAQARDQRLASGFRNIGVRGDDEADFVIGVLGKSFEDIQRDAVESMQSSRRSAPHTYVAIVNTPEDGIASDARVCQHLDACRGVVARRKPCEQVLVRRTVNRNEPPDCMRNVGDIGKPGRPRRWISGLVLWSPVRGCCTVGLQRTNFGAREEAVARGLSATDVEVEGAVRVGDHELC